MYLCKNQSLEVVGAVIPHIPHSQDLLIELCAICLFHLILLVVTSGPESFSPSLLKRPLTWRTSSRMSWL